jgi:hypothetical protein
LLPSSASNLLTSPPQQLTSKRTSNRYSTYSHAPSLTPTAHTSLTTDSAHAELTTIEQGLEKLENKKLTTQRYVLNQEKTENLSKLALGAKLERALGRRMGGQDAEMRVKRKVKVQGAGQEMSEKGAIAA